MKTKTTRKARATKTNTKAKTTTKMNVRKVTTKTKTKRNTKTNTRFLLVPQLTSLTLRLSDRVGQVC